MLKVLDVDGAVQRVKGGWQATGQPWAYDTERHERIAAARSEEQQAMRGYQKTENCRMEFLRRCLDDSDAVACGRCDRCATPRFAAEVSAAALQSAQTFLGRPGLSIEPRRMWPTGLKAAGVPLSGKIAPDEQALAGRAVGRLTDLGWGGRLRTLLAEEAPDGPAAADLLNAVVEVLKSWASGPQAWQQRPVAVVAMGSSRRRQLITSVAEHIAKVGRLPMLGTIATHSTVDAGRANSAHRVRALHGTFGVPAEVAAQGPVLLVDDCVDSGWTMALAARELRLAGVPAVLPLALAVTS
jgi:ATP-dependent DNA helicase RecQ